jgi:polysaccharide pyruvyl transferase WcaK-like protein
VIVRDPASLDHALDLGATTDATRLGGDVAIALLDAASPADPPYGPISVVLTANSDPDRADDLTENAFRLAEYVVEHAANRGLRVCLWSSAQAAGREEDGKLIAAVGLRLAATLRRHVEIIADHVHAKRMVELAGHSAAMVSMRFHPALLASAQGTPTMLVMSDQRAEAFQGTKLERWIVDPYSPCLGDRVRGLFDSLHARWNEAAVKAPMQARLATTEQALIEGLGHANAA